MAESHLLVAASGFALASAWGARVSAQHDIPGEPLTLRLPGPVRVHLLTGLGSGLSAPWPMPVAAIAADGRETWPGQLCIGLGAAAVLGILVEPVTWGRRSGARSVKAVVAAGLVSAIALILAGRRYLER
jgi:hypothetical protein